jgi:hypothetical protein
LAIVEPLKAVSTVSKALPEVSTVSVPLAVGMNLYQTEAPPPAPTVTSGGSLVSRVALALESVIVPVLNDSNCEEAK